jgi:hypothetical protein
MTLGIKTRVAVQGLEGKYDPFDINYAERPYDLFTDSELIAEQGNTLHMDTECNPNYFLLSFKSETSKKIIYFEIINDDYSGWNTSKIIWILTNFWTVGFNSIKYDIPLIGLIVTYEPTNEEIKAASNELIIGGMYPTEFYKQHKIHRPDLKHIDLIEVAPLMASLKTYGGRCHCERLQELPVDHMKVLDEREIRAVRFYNINDLDLTSVLLNELKPQIALRHQLMQEYGIDLLSKSDAQLAEAVICTELKRLNGYYPSKPKFKSGQTYKYQIPPYLHYENPDLKRMLEIVGKADFALTPEGTVIMPPELSKLKIRINKSTYKMGIGGLHSTESCVSYKADENTFLIDKDVASYYPAIILNLKLAPKHLGQSFLNVYRGIVERRLQAKRTGNKVVADSLKITINGSFGKLGNPYSALYSPDLMIQVTMTGQLCLLKLIELIEQQGVPVISANTDGVVSLCPKHLYTAMEAAVIHWQKLTDFETEETRYKALYARDVNNYIAVKEDGKCKHKGCYSEVGSALNSRLSKNPEAQICNDALTEFLAKGTPIDKTIRECKDIRKFISVRNVKGGAEKGGTYLGKSVRWYYSKTARGTINYLLTANKVPKTDNAQPLMDMPTELPDDLDYEYYIKQSTDMLHDIGYFGKPQELTLF